MPCRSRSARCTPLIRRLTVTTTGRYTNDICKASRAKMLVSPAARSQKLLVETAGKGFPGKARLRFHDQLWRAISRLDLQLPAIAAFRLGAETDRKLLFVIT